MAAETKQQEKITFSKAVKMAVESFRPGERFGGYELKERVVEIYPHCKNCYVDTILRTARAVARQEYKCVNITRGIYERTAKTQTPSDAQKHAQERPTG